MRAKVKCPVGHTRVWRHGTSPSRRGPLARYRCVVCGRTFYGTKDRPRPRRVRKSVRDE